MNNIYDEEENEDEDSTKIRSIGENDGDPNWMELIMEFKNPNFEALFSECFTKNRQVFTVVFYCNNYLQKM